MVVGYSRKDWCAGTNVGGCEVSIVDIGLHRLAVDGNERTMLQSRRIPHSAIVGKLGVCSVRTEQLLGDQLAGGTFRHFVRPSFRLPLPGLRLPRLTSDETRPFPEIRLKSLRVWNLSAATTGSSQEVLGFESSRPVCWARAVRAVAWMIGGAFCCCETRWSAAAGRGGTRRARRLAGLECVHLRGIPLLYREKEGWRGRWGETRCRDGHVKQRQVRRETAPRHLCRSSSPRRMPRRFPAGWTSRKIRKIISDTNGSWASQNPTPGAICKPTLEHAVLPSRIAGSPDKRPSAPHTLEERGFTVHRFSQGHVPRQTTGVELERAILAYWLALDLHDVRR